MTFRGRLAPFRLAYPSIVSRYRYPVLFVTPSLFLNRFEGVLYNPVNENNISLFVEFSNRRYRYRYRSVILSFQVEGFIFDKTVPPEILDKFAPHSWFGEDLDDIYSLELQH